MILLGALCASRPVPAGPAASPATPNKSRTSPPEDTTTKDLEALGRWNRRGIVMEPEALLDCQRLLTRLDRTWVLGAERSDEIQLALLDFLGRCLRIADEVARRQHYEVIGGALIQSNEADLRRRATEMLRRRLPETRRFLTLGVLMSRVEGQSQALERRLAACEVLKKDPHSETTLALLSCTRVDEESELDLLNAAVAGLAGRLDRGVHLRLLDLLVKAEAGQSRLWKSGVEKHFRQVEIPMEDPRSLDRVVEFVTQAIHSEDWRKASRGASIARCLPHSKIFPQLIEALGTWIERAKDEKRAVKRVQGEILGELGRRSGRSLGAHPERWSALWEGYLRGEISMKGEGRLPNRTTVGGFFGLRPETDRVTFVLDRSGSMEAKFGDGRGHTRLEESADQMAELLYQLGPRTRFNVVLFSDKAREWRHELSPADERTVKSARSWVRSTGAKGGTHLRDGVMKAMHVDARGKLDLEALEADTVIVLCDGETAEGPAWVASFLRNQNDDARIVFYAVQVGGSSDGTLEALCEATGGEFLLVDD